MRVAHGYASPGLSRRGTLPTLFIRDNPTARAVCFDCRPISSEKAFGGEAMKRMLTPFFVLIAGALSIIHCGGDSESDSNGSKGSGGQAGKGGASGTSNTGGASTGGASTGGASTGGSFTGAATT